MKIQEAIETHRECVEVLESMGQASYYKLSLEKSLFAEKNKSAKEKPFLMQSESWFIENINDYEKQLQKLKEKHQLLIKKFI